jgi:hypothetical protein
LIFLDKSSSAGVLFIERLFNKRHKKHNAQAPTP